MPGERAVAVDDEGTAVEHELVLPADLVDVDEGKTSLAGSFAGQRQALVKLSRPRRASRWGPAAIPRRRRARCAATVGNQTSSQIGSPMTKSRNVTGCPSAPC